MRYPSLLAIVLVLGHLASPSRALGDSFFIFAGGDLDWSPASGGFVQSSPHPVSDSTTMQDGFGSAIATASANPGIVRGSIGGSFNALALQSRRFNPGVTAIAHGFDVNHVNFNGPTPTVQTRAHLAMHGSLSVVTNPDPDPMAFALCRVSFQATVYGTITRMVLEMTADNQFTVVTNEFENVFPALIDDTLYFIGGENAQTPLIEVPTFQAVPANFTLEIKFNHYTSGFPGTSTFNADFTNTISWATGVPVFDVPEGYTVNGFGIVDNQFVVPEPATGVLALVGALALMGAAVRRTRQRSILSCPS